MSKPILVTAAVVSALTLTACGGTSKATPAETCRHGDALGARFNADMQRYVTIAQTNPVGADPGHVRRDLIQMGQMVTTLSHEDHNLTDQAHLAIAKRGLGDLEVAFADIHAGNEIGFLRELSHGARAAGSLSGASLSICTGV